MPTEFEAAANRPQVLFVAAENDALPGAKVGGIGDVLRDLPAALARDGVDVSVVLPSYGVLHQRSAASHIDTVAVRFGHGEHAVDVYALDAVYGSELAHARQFVLHCDDFAPCGLGQVYCDDPDNAPFATDATKYALFGAAVAEVLSAGHFGRADILHLHDWHAAFVSVLITADERYRDWRDRQRVFSIHNLALQGVRPFDGHPSSLAAWYPWLPEQPSALADPRWRDCFNPMAAGIRLAHRVHTVSPTYAEEVQQENDVGRGFHGGEGLHHDLARAAEQGRLFGILNGIDYPDGASSRADQNVDLDASWAAWMSTIATELELAIASDDTVRSVDWLAHRRACEWRELPRPPHTLTSIGRLVEQKAAILLATLDDGRSALEHLLHEHQDHLRLILIGSGDKTLEAQCRQIAARCPNLLFINRYAAKLANLAYHEGDLFLMPSSFEPCGISQMMAMRAGQPCLVHAVGGLVDTVRDGDSGFHFRGDSIVAQAQSMLQRVRDIIQLRNTSPSAWAAVGATAQSQRFDWAVASERYRSELYAFH